MNIEIELNTKVYECLVAIAERNNIALNLLIERYLLEILADKSAHCNN